MEISNGAKTVDINLNDEYKSSRAINKYTYNMAQLQFLGLTDFSINDYTVIVNTKKYRLAIKCYRDLYKRNHNINNNLLNNKYLTNINYLNSIEEIKKATGLLLVLINAVLSLYK